MTLAEMRVGFQIDEGTPFGTRTDLGIYQAVDKPIHLARSRSESVAALFSRKLKRN